MTIRLTVVHPSRSFVRGLESRVDSERFVFVSPDELGDGPGGVFLLAVFNDADWERLASLVARPLLTAVALIADLDVATYARALSVGVSGVAHVDADPETILVVATAALAGEIVLPAEAARAMARQVVGKQQAAARLDPSELEMLQKLSEGSTVVELAESGFLAERTVRRKLQNVYLKMGVGGRAEALKRAAQLGLLN